MEANMSSKMCVENVYEKLKIIEKKIDSFIEVTSLVMYDENLCEKCASEASNTSKFEISEIIDEEEENSQLEDNKNEYSAVEASNTKNVVVEASNSKNVEASQQGAGDTQDNVAIVDDDDESIEIDEKDSQLCDEFRQILINIDSHDAENKVKTLREVMKVMQKLKVTTLGYLNRMKGGNLAELVKEIDTIIEPNEDPDEVNPEEVNEPPEEVKEPPEEVNEPPKEVNEDPEEINEHPEKEEEVNEHPEEEEEEEVNKHPDEEEEE